MDFHFFSPQSINNEAQQETISFWLAEDALPPDVANKRSARVIAHAKEGQQIIAVATGEIQVPTLLNQPLFNYRSFVSVNERRKGAASELLQNCFHSLEKFFSQQENPAAIGVYCEIDPALAVQLDSHLLWPGSEFFFIGKNESGAHIRVRYFEKVKLKASQQIRQGL